MSRLVDRLEKAGPQFLERSAAENLGISPLTIRRDALIGNTIGAYTIKSLLAAGGMGAVYIAEQRSPRREVVMKVLRTDNWGADLKRRFDIESRVLAFLRHAGIVQVYESGTHELDTGSIVHFFAMEYVPNALAITDFAAEHGLSIEDRIRLFLQVCEAVSYGHQKGVIHRDLKPTNILVEEGGTAKVIDFGIARSTDADIAVTTMHTEPGQILGTLAYMSPEQCSANLQEIDTRSDVYSLGVILFELLTGRMPYDVSNMTIHAAVRVICETAPTNPRTLDHRVRTDLECVILKAIEKERDRRYQSVHEFSADLERVLRREPTTVQPPTCWMKLMRWTAAHPRLATTVFCLLILILTLAGTYSSVYVLNQRPARIQVISENREARLKAFNGRVLKRWTSDQENHVVFADIIRRPSSLGGDRLAILGFGNDAARQLAPLCVYAVDEDLAVPRWTGRVMLEDMPADLRAKDPSHHRFAVRFVGLFDVFPTEANPGPEVVVSFVHRGSRSVLRVYNLRWEPLYQIWRKGTITSARWLSGPGLLVLNGDDDEVKARFKSAGLDSHHAHVLMAIRPEAGTIATDYLSPVNATGPLAPVWFRYWHPTNSDSPSWNVEFDDGAVGSYAPTNFMGLSATIHDVSGDLPSFQFVVDSVGHEVAGSRSFADSYSPRHQKSHPDEHFFLSDEPPSPIPISATSKPNSE